jgi:hypothetical protein
MARLKIIATLLKRKNVMKNIISMAIMSSVICISDMNASMICPTEIEDSDLRSLEVKKPVTINSIELTNRGCYLHQIFNNQSYFKK